MLKIKVAKVLRYFSHTKIAILELSQNLTKNDELIFSWGNTSVKQKVMYFLSNYEKKDFACKGEIVGIKTQKEVKVNAEVFKIQ